MKKPELKKQEYIAELRRRFLMDTQLTFSRTTRFGQRFVLCVCDCKTKYPSFAPHCRDPKDLFSDRRWVCDGCDLMDRVGEVCNPPRTINPVPKFGLPPIMKYKHYDICMSRRKFYNWFFLTKHAIQSLNVYKDVQTYILSVLLTSILNLRNACYFRALETIRNLMEKEPVLTGNIHSLKRIYYSYTGQRLLTIETDTDSKKIVYITEIMKQHELQKARLLEKFGHLLKSKGNLASFLC